MEIKKKTPEVNHYMELCNLFSRIINSFPRIRQSLSSRAVNRSLYLDNPFWMLKSREQIAIRDNELLKSRKRIAIRECGLFNSRKRIAVRENELSNSRERINIPKSEGTDCTIR